jgi:copper resistance protein C
MTRRILAALMAASAAIAGGGTAEAHATLVTATPAVGSVVTSPPPEIRMVFSEGLESPFSSAELSTVTGGKIATGPAQVDPGKPKELVLPIRTPLTPGMYQVIWHVVSTDTHKTQGRFTFALSP